LDLALICFRESLQRQRQRQPQRAATHPVLGSLSDVDQAPLFPSGEIEVGSSQVHRGIARRREWQQVLVQHGPELRAIMRANLARALGVALDTLTPMPMMFRFHWERSPPGAHQPAREVLTHFAWLTAEPWQGRTGSAASILAPRVDLP